MGHSPLTITPTLPIRITKDVRPSYHWEYVLPIQCVRAEERVHYPGKQQKQTGCCHYLLRKQKKPTLRDRFWKINRQQSSAIFSIHPQPTTLLCTVQNLSLSALTDKNRGLALIPLKETCVKRKGNKHWLGLYYVPGLVLGALTVFAFWLYVNL